MPKLHGRKDDDWITVTAAKEFQIVLLTQESREDMNFEFTLTHNAYEDEEFCAEMTTIYRAKAKGKFRFSEPLRQV